MPTTAFEFILEAKKLPLGRNIYDAVIKSAQKPDRYGGIDEIKGLMKNAGVTDPGELAKAGDIYDAVLQFLDSTGFNPNLISGIKY